MLPLKEEAAREEARRL